MLLSLQDSSAFTHVDRSLNEMSRDIECAQICFSFWQNLHYREKYNLSTETICSNARKSVDNDNLDGFWQQILLEHLPKRSFWTANSGNNNSNNNTNSNRNSIDNTTMS